MILTKMYIDYFCDVLKLNGDGAVYTGNDLSKKLGFGKKDYGNLCNSYFLEGTTMHFYSYEKYPR